MRVLNIIAEEVARRLNQRKKENGGAMDENILGILVRMNIFQIISEMILSGRCWINIVGLLCKDVAG